MLANSVIEDPELGPMFVRVNPRARRLTFRAKPDGIHVTVPLHTSSNALKEAVEALRPRLRKAKAEKLPTLIDLDFRIETELFKLSLVGGQQKQFLVRSEAGEMQIVCPPDIDFKDRELQVWLRKVIGEALRKQAKMLLPPRLRELSLKSGLPFKSVKINSSHGRWGSCSIKKDINLSCHLVLLPRHLVDYVMLHELCHTREMNHGEHFWALLDKLTDGKAEALRQELKRYKSSF